MPQQITLFEQSQNRDFSSAPPRSGILLGGGGCEIGRRKKLIHTYNNIISLENLFSAWEEFIIGKRKKVDVIKFSNGLLDSIVELHESLVNKTYRHGGYESFFVNDPKRRHIHKASVRDRLVHHAIYRILYPFFEKTFIADSFSCRLEKGTHKAINRFREMFYEVSKNDHRSCWVLKCDIRKFFGSIDHAILLKILGEYIQDKDIMGLLENVILSFPRKRESAMSLRGTPAGSDEAIPPYFRTNLALQTVGLPRPLAGARNDKIGLPLGNLTSKLFANVYMNVFDKWVKHKLKVKYYIRYADDFVFLSDGRQFLTDILPQARIFLSEKLKLDIHPNKIFLKTFASGMDYLGWVNFAGHRILRRSTQKRMFTRIKANPKSEVFQSYVGLLRHGNTNKLRGELVMDYWMYSGLNIV